MSEIRRPKMTITEVPVVIDGFEGKEIHDDSAKCTWFENLTPKYYIFKLAVLKLVE